MARARSFRPGAVALLALMGTAGAWLAWSHERPSGQRDVLADVTESSSAQRLALLDNSLRALADVEREMARDRWDAQWVVEQVGRNADSLRHWVAERTAWVPYRGSLRGPVGVLMDRRGNSLDRSLLLSELLTSAGHRVRLAHAELAMSEAESLLPVVLTSGARAAEEPIGAPAQPTLREVAAGYGSNATSVMHALAPQLDATDSVLTQLEDRTTRHTALLLEAVPGPDAAAEWKVRRDTVLATLRDHWWVQVLEGDAWRDLDVVPRDTIHEVAPVETGEPEAEAATGAHAVLLRVVAERRTGGELRESPVLEYTLRPAMTDSPVILQLWPTAWPSTGLSSTDSGTSFRRAALQQRQWFASLVVKDREVTHALINDAADDPGAASASGPFGGLGGAVDGALRPTSREADADDLTAVWLEYEVRVPGRQPRVERRQVFDLIGAAARQAGAVAMPARLSDSLRLARNLALMMRTEILVLGAHLAPEFVVHRFARDAVGNSDLLHAVALPGFTKDPARADSLLRASRADVGPLHTLAVLRQEALGDLAFLDRPLVLARHQYPVMHAGTIAAAEAFDIVANEIGISLAEGDGFGARMAQGVWDTNLEALLGGRDGNAAEAFEREGDWSVLDSATQVGADRLTADMRSQLASELQRGAIAVAPDATAMPGAPAAWWRIAPATGDVLGIGPLGWGQGVDYGTHLSVIWEMSKGMVFAYAECQAIPQAANALNILGDEFWRLGLTPEWVTQPPNSNLPEFSASNPKAYKKDVKDFFRGDQRQRSEGKDFEDVAYENHRKCLLDAIRSGFLATAPILLMHIRAEVAMARRMRVASRARGGPLISGRRPPSGFRGRPPTPRRGPRVSRGARPAPAPPPAPAAPHRYDPRPADGRVPAGKGPFQGDPANREWHRENWHPDPTQAHPATRAMGSPEIYDNADRAAVARYDAARQSGMDDQAARAESFKEWRQAAQDGRRARGIYQFPGVFPAEPGGGAWAEWVPDHPIGSPSPPPGSPPPGASPPGTSAGGGAAAVPGSPMATSVGPAPAPLGYTSPLSDARMTVGFAGLTGSK
jgi:hypothetical protein